MELINPELLNEHARDAKHVLSFATSREYRDPSAPSRSHISRVPQLMLYIGDTGGRLGDRFREHLRGKTTTTHLTDCETL